MTHTKLGSGTYRLNREGTGCPSAWVGVGVMVMVMVMMVMVMVMVIMIIMVMNDNKCNKCNEW